ncbi:MAG: hypothetical protein QNL58_03850 [Octadecabacter sp.]
MSKSNRRDFYSGIPWEHVTRAQAHSLPQGMLGLILWGAVIYFIGIGILKFYLTLNFGASVGVAVLNSIWPILTGLGLAFRVPWAVIMAMISAALTVYALIRGLGGDGSLITLAEVLINVGILFYLIDGDRPNLIYRHRYRKYSVDEDDAEMPQD